MDGARGKQVIVVDLDLNSGEFQKVEKQFKATLPATKVTNIKRIQNKWVWKAFQLEVNRMTQIYDSPPKTLTLFHGTSNTQPSLIYESDQGFDLKFASAKCFWGRANYFAEKASYSHEGFRHQLADGSFQMLVAKVIVGNFYDMGTKHDTTLTHPPLLPGSTINRYDSIKGNTANCDVYMTYSNQKCYPEYLISYTI